MSMTDDKGCAENTDVELWREGEFFSPNSIHRTKEGSIGINVGGHVIVMPLKAWHGLAARKAKPIAEERVIELVTKACGAESKDAKEKHDSAEEAGMPLPPPPTQDGEGG